MEQSNVLSAQLSYRVALAWLRAICTDKVDVKTAELVRAYQIADEWCALLSDDSVSIAVRAKPSAYGTVKVNSHLLYGPKTSEILNRCPSFDRYAASLIKFREYRNIIVAKLSAKIAVVWNVVSELDFSDYNEVDGIAIWKDRAMIRAKRLFNACNRVPGLKAEFDIALIDPLYTPSSTDKDIAAYWNAFSVVNTELYINKTQIHRRFGRAVRAIESFLSKCDPVLQKKLDEA